MTHICNRKGFTLAEMIITVAVLTILIGVSIPGVFEFIKMRDRQLEENQQDEIHKALEGFVSANGGLPQDTGTTTVNGQTYPTWVTQLASYTKLNLDQIANDAWGHPRIYVAQPVTVVMDASTITANYATIVSEGPNARADQDAGQGFAMGNAVPPHFAASTVQGANGWWSNFVGINIQAGFTNLKIKTGTDDMLMKFTDYAQKMSGYAETTRRLDRIIGALENYAKENYSTWKQYCVTHSSETWCQNNNPEKIVYYPLSKPRSNVPDSNAVYYNPATQTVGAASTLTPVVDNGSTRTDTQRRTDMTTLMRTLGLPDNHCCSAVEMSNPATGGDGKPFPFYYNSNPRTVTATGTCPGTRPGAADPKLPPRITTIPTGTTDTCD